MGRARHKSDLMPGTLDILVLKTLTRGNLPGYAIAQLIQQLSEDILQVEENSLYPALQRLELNVWIAASGAYRRTRFYKLTPEGRKQLSVEKERYRQQTHAIARVMGPP
jgi:PadR family transcriptional regulator PadR